MSLITIIFLITTSTAISGHSCGRSPIPMRPNRKADLDGQRIVGGVEARPGSHPWVVSLQRYGAHICGGTLIRVDNREETDIVITAAHCLLDSIQDLTVVIGAHNFHYPQLGQETIRSINMISHPQYNPDTGLNDIAIVRLSTPVRFSRTVQPACLPTQGESVPDSTEGTVVGWGYIDETSYETSRKLMQVGVPVVNSQVCINSYRNSGTIISPKEMLCAGHMTGGKDSCQGDSGGPFIVHSTQGYVFHGIVSFGEGCGRIGKPGVYTRVSNYVTWIQSQIR